MMAGVFRLGIALLLPRVRCSLCGRHYLHSSSTLLAGRLKNVKNKTLKPILHKPKALRNTRLVLPIYNNMTIRQVAALLDKDIDHVFDALTYIKDTENYDTPDSVIEKLDVVKAVLDKSGFRFRIVEQKVTTAKESMDIFRRPPADRSAMVRRPPVITIMGHVDHGKTTLLDALRKTNIVDSEFGGITQHIGAFSVGMKSGEMITFLDTPGHAAFTAMRGRGARVTDIIILMVAVDDGVMQQTVECIEHARQAAVPIIVALNKVDKAPLNVEKSKEDLLKHGVQLEDFGGDIQAVPISALKEENLDELQDAILALSEVLQIRCDPGGPVEGTIIESRYDVGRGKLATVLVQRGTLQKGACLVAGTARIKVRAMFDSHGQPVVEATPGMPVEVIGWRDLPSAGDEILQTDSERHAKAVVEWRSQQKKTRRMEDDAASIEERVTAHREQYSERRQAQLAMGRRRSAIYRRDRQKETGPSDGMPQLAVIIKGDVDGSIEAILDTLDTYDSSQCRLEVMHYGVGVITQQDVEMAAMFNGIIYGFNVRCADGVMELAESGGVSVRQHNIIYRLMDDIRHELTIRLPALHEQQVLGEANVQDLFLVTEGKKKVAVAGCRCVKGSLDKKKLFKLVRQGTTIAEGRLSSLKHFKNEVERIKMDVECGLSFEDRTVRPQTGDTVVCYELKEIERKVNWKMDF